MRKQVLTIALGAACSTGAAFGAANALDPRVGLDAASLEQTCKHYQNRARFVERGPGMPLAAVLADSCTKALHELQTGVTVAPYEAKRARIFLERLTAFKSQVIQMNRAGFAEARQRRPAQLGGAPRVKVSATGEYLIARRMGVLDSYRDWVRASGFQLVAD